MPLEEVVRRTDELLANMKAVGHSFILGSRSTTFFVPEARDAIQKKVDAMMAVTIAA